MNTKNILIILLFAYFSFLSAQIKTVDNYTNYQSFTKEDLILRLKNKNAFYDVNLQFKYKGFRELVYYKCNDTIFSDCTFKFIKEFNEEGMLTYDSICGDGTFRTRMLHIQDSLLLLKYFFDKYEEITDSIIINKSKVDSFIINNKREPLVIKTEHKNSWISYDKKNRVVFQKDSTYNGRVSIDSISYYTDSVVVINTSRSLRGMNKSVDKYFFNKKGQIIKHIPRYSNAKLSNADNSSGENKGYYDVKYSYNNRNELSVVKTRNLIYRRSYDKKRLSYERLFECDSLIDIKEYRYPKIDSTIIRHKHLFSPTSACVDSSIYYNKKGKSLEYLHFHSNAVIYKHLDINGITTKSMDYTLEEDKKNLGGAFKIILKK